MAPTRTPPTTREELDALSVVDPEFAAAIAAGPHQEPLPEEDKDNLYAFRANRAAHLARLRHLYRIPGEVPEVAERMAKVPMRDGHEIDVKIYNPKSPPKQGSPLVVMFHEGGWCMGDLTDEDLNCRMFVRDLGCVCVNVDYRLAPEHQFPVAVNDCWDALTWCAANAASIGADPTKGFLTGGASAGGNLSAIMSQLGRDKKLSPPLTGTYLSVPALLLPSSDVPFPDHLPKELYVSYETNTQDPVLRTPTMDGIKKVYNPDFASPLASPLLDARRGVGLPRCYMQLAGMDPLRDDGVAYERQLREAGVPTRLEIYGGLGHMFFSNFPTMERSVEFVGDTLEGVRWLLQRE